MKYLIILILLSSCQYQEVDETECKVVEYYRNEFNPDIQIPVCY